MIVRTSRVKGEHATYKNVRGPTGERYAAWRDGLRRRALERYGLDEKFPDGRLYSGLRRAMRNARKQERRTAR